MYIVNLSNGILSQNPRPTSRKNDEFFIFFLSHFGNLNQINQLHIEKKVDFFLFFLLTLLLNSPIMHVVKREKGAPERGKAKRTRARPEMVE